MEMYMPDWLKKDTTKISKIETPEEIILFDDMDIPRHIEKSERIDEKKPLSKIQVEKLENLARSLKEEEVEVVLDNIPIELIFRKMEKEIVKNREFIQAISGAMAIVK